MIDALFVTIIDVFDTVGLTAEEAEGKWRGICFGVVDKWVRALNVRMQEDKERPGLGQRGDIGHP